MAQFTKIYDEERKLLRKANNVNAYEVYMHLKNDNSFFKGEFYDLTRCMAEYLDMSESTLKRALKSLKDVGLIQTKKKGKVNIYILPYDNNTVISKEDGRKKEAVVQEEEQQTEQECPTVHTEPIISPIYEEVEQSNSVVQEKAEVKNVDFYYQFVSGSIQYWIKLYKANQRDILNKEIERCFKYVSTFNYDMTEEDCYKKIFNYITANIAS